MMSQELKNKNYPGIISMGYHRLRFSSSHILPDIDHFQLSFTRCRRTQGTRSVDRPIVSGVRYPDGAILLRKGITQSGSIHTSDRVRSGIRRSIRGGHGGLLPASSDGDPAHPGDFRRISFPGRVSKHISCRRCGSQPAWDQCHAPTDTEAGIVCKRSGCSWQIT